MSRYAVESLSSQKNKWEEVYGATSVEKAKKDAREFAKEAQARRASGKIHYCVAVRVVRPGAEGTFFYLECP